MPRCSIIIPVYNYASLTDQCLSALVASGSQSVDYEIIVVDDDSTDSTWQLLASYGDSIHIVRHTTNTGFATACNDGAAIASGEYLVFLNNDTIPTTGWLEALVRYADHHPDAAVVGSKLLFPNDTIQHAGVAICQDHNPRHLYAGFPADHPAVNKSRRVQIVTAGCALIRRELFERMGGFDPTFRNGYEDVDLCLRLSERGYEIHYCHESVLYHLESVSEGRFAHDKENVRLYRSRWAERVQPDDMRYYLEDGLLKVVYGKLYPIQLAISPLLALPDVDDHERQADQLLSVRARQVGELLKETIRLTVLMGEAGLGMPSAQPIELQRRQELNVEHEVAWRAVAELQQVALGQSGQPGMPAARDKSPSSREEDLQAMLLNAHDRLLHRDDEIQAALYDLQVALAALQPYAPDGGAAVDTTSRSFAPSKYLGYRQLVHRIRQVVRMHLPDDAQVIVVSKGDDDLLDLDGRPAQHFPQEQDGGYAGYYPADSCAAMDHLETLRARGGDFLLFPKIAFWWLDHYVEFRRYLDARYRCIWNDENCIIYWLSEPESDRIGVQAQNDNGCWLVGKEG
jgi:GT2 family glycosyltransferase